MASQPKKGLDPGISVMDSTKLFHLMGAMTRNQRSTILTTTEIVLDPQVTDRQVKQRTISLAIMITTDKEKDLVLPITTVNLPVELWEI